MKPIFVKMLLFFSLISAVGCSPIYYKPTLMNVPNFRESRELFVAGNVGSSGTDAELAYAVSNHFAIQGNYMEAYEEASSIGPPPTLKYTGEGNLTEFAAGYFTKIVNFPRLGFSICGGYGLGKVLNDRDIDGASSAKFNKSFIQQTLGFRDKNVEIIASVKFAKLKYTNLIQNYARQSLVDDFDALKNPIGIIEMGLIGRLGFRGFKFQSQINSTKLLSNSPLFKYDEGAVSVGICIQLNTKRNENKDEIERKKKTSKFEWF
jgi:hypothetical protein